MDLTSVLIIVGSFLFTGGFIWILVRHNKMEPLTFAEYFMKDKSGSFIHILGARRIMPENGDSFDIFEHYVLDLQELKFTKGGSQQGKNLDLRSEFVKRSMAQLSQKLNVTLSFVQVKEDFDDEQDGYLRVYRFDAVQTDTEVIDSIHPDCLVFVDKGDEADHFSMLIYRGGNLLKRHEMRGMSDYFFKTIYFDDRNWLCFLYRKQKVARSGMAVCIINYETGAMIFDGFVQPTKA
jgi:hypothetical protein